jgi:O-antigen/teichoic acid export membrane protein
LLWPTVVVTIGDLGLANSFTFYTAQRPSLLGWLRGTAVKASVLQSLYLVPLGLGIAYLGLSAANVTPISAGLVLAASFIPAALISRYTAAILQGRLELTSFYAIRLSMQFAAAVVMIALLAVSGLTVWGAVAAYLAGLGVMTVLTVILLIRVPSAEPGVGDSAPLSIAGFLGYGVRSLIGSLYPMETLFADQALVAILLSPRDLGIYVSALAFSGPPRLVGYAIGVAAMPEVAAAQPTEQRAVGHRYVLLALLMLVPITIVLLALMGTLVTVLFGHEYDEATTPARLLLLGGVAYAVRRVVGDCLRGVGRPGLTSVVEFGSWPLLLGGAAVGTAVAGLTGVAVGLLIAQVIALAAILVAWIASGRAPAHATRGTIE